MTVKTTNQAAGSCHLGESASQQIKNPSSSSPSTQLFQKTISNDTPSIIEEKIIQPTLQELPEAKSWFESQKLTLAQIGELSQDFVRILKINGTTKEFIKEYEKKNGLTKNDGRKTYANKTLYGNPFDHNRLGKIGEKEITYSNGVTERKSIFVPGFEDFYIAGSPIELPYRNFDLMQAPITIHKDKEDTVQDFWNTVVVMRKSPIIVTLHDPKEKIPHYGFAERAEYWTQDRFPMQLKDGWQLSKVQDDSLLAQGKYSEEMRLVKRQFIAKNSATQEERIITQFHYQGWPDHCGAPDHELLEKLHQAIDQEMKQRNLDPKVPITAHCAAGQGRSAVFTISNVLRHEFLSRVKNGENPDEIKLDVAKTVYLFNQQRPSVLGGDDQWQSVLIALKRAYLQLKDIPNEQICALEKVFETEVLEKSKQLQEEAIRKRAEKMQLQVKAVEDLAPPILQANWGLQQHFGSIVVINLKKHTDRKENMTKALSSIGVNAKNFEFFTAIDGRKELPKEIWKKVYMNWDKIDTTTAEGQAKLDRQHQGEAGCYMSHFQLIQKVHDQFESAQEALRKAQSSGDLNQIAQAEAQVKKYSSVLILEDSCGFGVVRKDRSVTLAHTEEIFKKAMQELPSDWQMLYFNALARKPSKKIEGSSHIVQLMGADHLNAYAISHTMYKPLIEALKPILDPSVKKIMPVDTTIHSLHPTHRCYCITPSIAYQEKRVSAITSKEKRIAQQQAI